jgi:hypothetical protein
MGIRSSVLACSWRAFSYKLKVAVHIKSWQGKRPEGKFEAKLFLALICEGTRRHDTVTSLSCTLYSYFFSSISLDRVKSIGLSYA